MWKLLEDDGQKRLYTNDATGSRCYQTMCYKDRDGNLWWAFDDLFCLPYTRNFAATKVTSLFGLGMTIDDLNNHLSSVKAMLRSNDPEKYEKIYSMVLDFESKSVMAGDPIRQMTSLVCVYFTMNDEPIDSFEDSYQSKKLSLITADPAMHSFFLSYQGRLTESYTNRLGQISQIVL